MNEERVAKKFIQMIAALENIAGEIDHAAGVDIEVCHFAGIAYGHINDDLPNVCIDSPENLLRYTNDFMRFARDFAVACEKLNEVKGWRDDDD